MNHDELDGIFTALRGVKSSHAGSTSFHDGVWREIRHRKALGEVRRVDEGWFEGFREFFLPAAVTGMACSIFIAWLIGTTWISQLDSNEERTTAKVLNLGVFDPRAQGLPHNKLVAGR